MREVLDWIGKFVIDGPVAVDWRNRYGWTILSIGQLDKLYSDLTDTAKQWSAEWRREKGID